MLQRRRRGIARHLLCHHVAQRYGRSKRTSIGRRALCAALVSPAQRAPFPPPPFHPHTAPAAFGFSVYLTQHGCKARDVRRQLLLFSLAAPVRLLRPQAHRGTPSASVLTLPPPLLCRAPAGGRLSHLLRHEHGHGGVSRDIPGPRHAVLRCGTLPIFHCRSSRCRGPPPRAHPSACPVPFCSSLRSAAGTFLFVATVHILPELTHGAPLSWGDVGLVVAGLLLPILLNVEHGH